MLPWILSASLLHAQAAFLIHGIGASFPYPLYDKWAFEYQKLHPEVKLNYQPIGSGAGIRQLLAKTIDFGASDIPMTDAQLRSATTPILHVPTALGAIVLLYHLPEPSGSHSRVSHPNPPPLRLSATHLSDLFLGKITQWDDPQIQKNNPNRALPPLKVTIVHRSDGSGASALLTQYLSQVSTEWKNQVGTGTSVSWPVGLGGKGNEGVASLVQAHPGALGFVELLHATHTSLPSALLENQEGHFVSAQEDSIWAAVASLPQADWKDFRMSLIRRPGLKTYPIVGLTYLLIRPQERGTRAEALESFLNWAMTSGQKFVKELSYVSLPPHLLEQIRKTFQTTRHPIPERTPPFKL